MLKDGSLALQAVADREPHTHTPKGDWPHQGILLRAAPATGSVQRSTSKRTKHRGLDPGNKDSILGAIVHWLVEICELDSSFKKDVARLKGFLPVTVTRFGGHTVGLNLSTRAKQYFSPP